ncbi:S1/P1 nuclease [Pelomonas sp. KK5]|uniref:S1/P1 nuclease n=1 Tax=Pelomonas sp. KK5 TaxID=1855730 RepID=UPI001301FE96|nr:S1/P1 nuclease [Pelomonas sp. KK5]
MRSLLALCFMILAGPAWGWGSAGHRETGALAEAALRGTPAAAQVRRILGGESLASAAIWADCVKDPQRDPACSVFGVAEMAAFEQRNPGHRRWHYTDIAIQQDRYDERFTGARPDDVVHALQAAIARLQHRPVPAPFKFADGPAGEHEALRLLAHLVGDLHQPLHVGAIYLSPGGRALDPDRSGDDPDTHTAGGNLLIFDGGQQNLHALWDAAPPRPSRVASPRRPQGPLQAWPVDWAGETLLLARLAFEPLRFEAKTGKTWPLVFTDRRAYERQRLQAQARQVALAGLRMAELLKAIWSR